MSNLSNKGERNELIQSAKSKFYYATRFQKAKQKDVQPAQDVPRTSTMSAFVLTPTVSLASLTPTGSRQKTTADRVGTVPWPNVKEYYELLEVVGVGTTAQVYAAFCTPRKEKCAIKLVNLKKWTSGLENLLKDVQAMTAMNHENLVTYFTAFVDRDELWLVLQYMEHRSLMSVIRRKSHATNCKHGVFDEQTIATIVTGVLSGLEFIHSNGYIHSDWIPPYHLEGEKLRLLGELPEEHTVCFFKSPQGHCIDLLPVHKQLNVKISVQEYRDIKAENILLGASGHVQIADFATTNCTAKSRTFVGSPCWLAPEIIEDPDHKYSSKADIWSLGITIIEMATGFPPYHKHPTMKVLMLILLNESPCLETDAEVRDQYKKYGKTFRSLIYDCLTKDPSKRPSATELLFHPFFKKTQDQNYLQQVFAGIPPDPETGLQKSFVKMESLHKQSRREWIPEPEDTMKTVEVSNVDNHQVSNTDIDKRGTTVTHESVKTSASLKTRSSVCRKQSRIINVPSIRGAVYVMTFILKIRGLHLDTPMILKTAIRKERELFDIKFTYFVDRDCPEAVASDLVREGLIDPRDRIPVATNLKNLIRAAVQNTVTFPLISDITNTETPCEWQLIGYASLALVGIHTSSAVGVSSSVSSTISSKAVIKSVSH